jgi:hypothetical protein
MPTYANGPAPVTPIAGGGLAFAGPNPREPLFSQQLAPATYAAVATLTAADLAARIIVASGTTYTLTLPTAVLLDAAFPNAHQKETF